ncbi:pyruvate kinase [Acidihalobacter ferrooxydans]|uniref:Pyruvate kinase n=1 Tax=Acidihalobacter ferrooxydans TaxID=1765967 RepID=A0A1P8UEN8_9GAMM|nr:pyruvate kinase [Acidihalobacter ferrooxydans]APZ42323.1 pyruvate kinase [Acidihalobacter ferrooxydans]
MPATLASHKTKIVCTIGPASAKPAVLARMIRAGMNVARINLAHGDPHSHTATIARVREAAAQAGRDVAILADLPGPKLRIGTLSPDPLRLHHGQRFTLTTEDVPGTVERVSVPDFAELPQAVRAGESIFLNDGFIQLKVLEIAGPEVRCRVTVGGELRSHKGLNIPHMHIRLPAFTERDQSLLAFACEQQVDAVSISFVENAADIERVRREAVALGAAPLLIAKIERADALTHFDEILAAADGCMVARGDLGVETPIEAIALVQKRLIRKANARCKPVITATQMLESMVDHSRPTRAEATDVANAVLDGTDAVMLSEESAIGTYPVEAVKMLGRIARQAEAARGEHARAPVLDDRRNARHSIEDTISLNVVTAVGHLRAAYVFTPTETGATARRIARFHLPTWTIALSRHDATCRRLLFSYGVHPVHTAEDARDWRDIAYHWMRENSLVGDPLIFTLGTSRGHPGTTNRVEILPGIGRR